MKHCTDSGYGYEICSESFIPGEVVANNTYYPFGMLFDHQYQVNNENAYKNTYNGKELQESGLYDYGWRQYMPDIARWGAVDNKAEKYNPFSPYHYAGNNPISNIDIDGNEFTPEAWEYVNKLIADINTRQAQNNAKIAEYRAKIETGGKAGQIKGWEKSIANLQENNAGMEEARSEIGVLANSDQTYHIRSDDSMSEKGSSVSYTMFGFSTGRVIIGLSSNADMDLLSHELKHAYQFEIGESSFINEELHLKNADFLHDKNDELDGFKRGGLFGGSVYKINNLPDIYRDLPTGPVNVKNHPQIIQALSLPASQRNQALQKIANEGKAFRISGKTYYKK